VYKPTKEMQRYFFTKALQGKLFAYHCKTLMGLDGVDEVIFYKRYKKAKQLLSTTATRLAV
jgi:hypothetical protein